MQKIINNLRQKPVHVRRTIAFITSIAITGVIGLVWVSSLLSINNSPSNDSTSTEKTPSPFALMIEQIKDFGHAAGNQLAEVSSAFNFLESTTTISGKNIVATSTDGTIGVSTVNHDSDNSNVNSLTEEQ